MSENDELFTAAQSKWPSEFGRRAVSRNPVGVETFLLSNPGLFAALTLFPRTTLGWRAQSLWDWSSGLQPKMMLPN